MTYIVDSIIGRVWFRPLSPVLSQLHRFDWTRSHTQSMTWLSFITIGSIVEEFFDCRSIGISIGTHINTYFRFYIRKKIPRITSWDGFRLPYRYASAWSVKHLWEFWCDLHFRERSSLMLASHWGRPSIALVSRREKICMLFGARIPFFFVDLKHTKGNVYFKLSNYSPNMEIKFIYGFTMRWN